MSNERDKDGDLVIDRPPIEERKDLVPPPKYGVIFLNDDFTPMDFVVALLVQLFNKTTEEAGAIMMEVHKHGKGLAGTYSREIAETKVAQVNAIAQQHEHPFKADMQALH